MASCNCSQLKLKYGFVDTRALCDPANDLDTFLKCPFKEQWYYDLVINNTQWCNSKFLLTDGHEALDCPLIEYFEENNERYADINNEEDREKIMDSFDDDLILEWLKEDVKREYSDDEEEERCETCNGFIYGNGRETDCREGCHK